MTVGTNLTARDMEIVNLATSLVAGCQPCLKFHLRKCRDAGLSENEINGILSQAEKVYVLAIRIMKSRALEIRCENRMELLVGLAVSFTVNNTDISERYLQYARQSGMSDPEISRIRGISDFILSKARAHMDLLIEDSGHQDQDRVDDQGNCGCGC